MQAQCQGDSCRVTSKMRLVLIFAGAYHLLFAIWAICWPSSAIDLLQLPEVDHPILWRALGLLSLVLGVGLLIAAKDPIQHWVIVLLGLVKSAAAFGLVSVAVINSDLPVSTLAIVAVDDLVWLPFFALILWSAIRAHAGIPPSRRTPYSIEEAAASYQLSTGQTLAEASSEKPLVLVFLRHFGCTFTRQILRGLQGLEQQAKRNNASLVIVHMLQSGQETNYLGDNSNVPRIADPRCELYRAFGLGKGGFLELFGPYVWWQMIISMFRGCGVGHLAGDGLQMPGAFVFHDGKVVASQPAHTAADLPDLVALFEKNADASTPRTAQ